MVREWFDLMRGLVRAATVSFLLVAAFQVVEAEQILDDPFEGDSLDPKRWEWFSDNPELEPTVSAGRLTLSAPGGAITVFGFRNVNYRTALFYDVRLEATGDDFSFDFGYGIGLLEHADLYCEDSGLSLGYTYSSGQSGVDLGPWVDGDYAIAWTPSFLNIYRGDELIFSESDAERVPYYEWMNFGMEVRDGTVSLDRVVVLIPEPGTLTLLVAGSVLCLRRRGRRQEPPPR